MHACMYEYIHRCIRAYVHTRIHAYPCTYISTHVDYIDMCVMCVSVCVCVITVAKDATKRQRSGGLRATLKLRGALMSSVPPLYHCHTGASCDLEAFFSPHPQRSGRYMAYTLALPPTRCR